MAEREWALDADALVAAAVERAGHDDFGEPTWREGLDRLVDSVNAQSQANEIGRAVIEGDLGGYLDTRLALVEWRHRHPEVAATEITPPIVIVGQARTGTTILFDLLAQDPAHRAPLTWEVDAPVPPPTSDTYDTDPRIATIDERLAGVELLIPGFRAMHPMGARLAQECVRITGGDFRSMIFPTQWRVPAYGRWLVAEADLAPAYRYHRRFLEHIGSRHPGERWLLKSPGHIWALEALLAEYPEALVVQTHRDPLTTIASVSSLVALLRRLVSDSPDIVDIAAEFSEYLIEGFDRSVTARERGLVDPHRVVDVAFDEFMADPMATIGHVYDGLGLELSAAAEARIAAFSAEHGRERHGRHTYTFADTALAEGEIRERTARYVDYFGVRT